MAQYDLLGIDAGSHLHLRGEPYGYAEVDLDLADGVAEILELAVRIDACVDGDDALDAAHDHLVDAKV